MQTLKGGRFPLSTTNYINGSVCKRLLNIRDINDISCIVHDEMTKYSPKATYLGYFHKSDTNLCPEYILYAGNEIIFINPWSYTFDIRKTNEKFIDLLNQSMIFKASKHKQSDIGWSSISNNVDVRIKQYLKKI